ncbi:DUF2785 domain-containing protein [Longispora albida]|uniref:DUF2785 domain-containing protein n=1 Tax=Longispora albida TaxID=203523 RepID=UPI00036FDB04|nr:DUF2785 domain-containing protein [Longispora albida]
MTDWKLIAEADYAVPAGRDLDELVAELVPCLRHPDPEIRDGFPYRVLFTWLDRGVLNDHLSRIGDEAAGWFGHEEIQARTFAPLVLDGVVSAGGFAPEWVSGFSAWYPEEKDLRGFDPELGWLHAVAHGADLLGVFGRHENVAPESMLDLAARRLTAETEFVLRDQEDDRLGHAIGLALTRAELTAEGATAWLETIRETLLARAKPGPLPAWVSNTIRTLRVVYLLCDRGIRPQPRGEEVELIPHAALVKDKIAEVLAIPAPFTG